MKDRNSRKNQNKRNIKLKPKKDRFSIAAIFRFFKVGVLTLTLCSLMAVSVYYGNKAVGHFLSKPIAKIEIEAEFNYFEKMNLEQLISQEVKKSFLKESLKSIQGRLEENPWIDHVVLRRQWPDLLHVRVVEQKPIAKWGESGFVNYRGELFNVGSIDSELDKLNGLPILYGKKESILDLMKQYQLLSEVITQYDLSIVSLRESELGVWKFKLNNHWQFIAGRNEVVQKLQRVMEILSTNKIRRQDEIDMIDMRYENGLAIRWKKTEQHAQSEVQDGYVEKEENI